MSGDIFGIHNLRYQSANRARNPHLPPRSIRGRVCGGSLIVGQVGQVELQSSTCHGGCRTWCVTHFFTSDCFRKVVELQMSHYQLSLVINGPYLRKIINSGPMMDAGGLLA